MKLPPCSLSAFIGSFVIIASVSYQSQVRKINRSSDSRVACGDWGLPEVLGFSFVLLVWSDFIKNCLADGNEAPI